MKKNDLLKTTQKYYNSPDADNFYHSIWGSEDIHIGIYDSQGDDIFTASQRTVQKMVSRLRLIDKNTKILDLGAGYGGAARYLASNFNSQVTCLNLSEKENKRNQQKNESQGLSKYIDVYQGNFEATSFENDQFDIVWSEEALLHSGNKSQVFQEVARILKKNGQFIFTDAMQADDCPKVELQPILDRIHLKELGSISRYRTLAKEVGLNEVEVIEMPEQLIQHYAKVQKELNAQYADLLKVCSATYLDKMNEGLFHWIDGGEKGYLNWGILLFKKP